MEQPSSRYRSYVDESSKNDLFDKVIFLDLTGWLDNEFINITRGNIL